MTKVRMHVEKSPEITSMKVDKVAIIPAVSPEVDAQRVDGGVEITVTDYRHTETVMVQDGDRGDPGTDGVSPTISVTDIPGGHRVTITDATGPHSFDVMDGDASEAPVQSVNGQTGDVVLDAQNVGAYEKPASGIPASDLAAGVIPEVPVQDVQVNGTSVLRDGVANVPAGSFDSFGAVRFQNFNMFQFDSSTGNVKMASASSNEIKAGTSNARPVSPYRQHESAFYALAKAAGDSTQSSSSNAVGNYTDDAKIAIQKMLGIYEAPWELIREDTITNATDATYDISVDSNGQAFELTDVIVILHVPSQSTTVTISGYGRVYFNSNGVSVRTAYLLSTSTKTINANTSSQVGIAKLLQNNGLMEVKYVEWSTDANHSSIRLTESSAADDSTTPYGLKTVTIDSISLSKFVGTMNFRVFGRRKWN